MALKHNKDYGYLYSICRDFRKKIDECVHNNKDLFDGFPHGYCAKISLWACDYLSSKGFKNIILLSHDPFLPNSDGNHVWLHWEKYHIDLSCDQFSNDNMKYDSVIIIQDGNDTTPEKRYSNQNEEETRNKRAFLEYVPIWNQKDEKERDLIYKALNIKYIAPKTMAPIN